MANLVNDVLSRHPISDASTGLISRPWLAFFAALLERAGGAGTQLTATELAEFINDLEAAALFVPTDLPPSDLAALLALPRTEGAVPAADPLAALLEDPPQPSQTLARALQDLEAAAAFVVPPALSDQTSGSFTVTGTGFAANPTGTALWERHGRTVCLYLPTLTGTSTATTFTLTGLPPEVTPTQSHYALVFVVDNGVNAVGLLSAIAASTTLTLYATVAGAGFTAAGTKILPNCWLTYALL